MPEIDWNSENTQVMCMLFAEQVGKEKFNRIHSSVRNVIECSFVVLNMKWQILYKMPGYLMVTQKKIVAATMVLHNFIREHASVDVDFANFDRDPTYMPTIL